MLVKQYRLRRNVDVVRVLREGKLVGGRLVRLKYKIQDSRFKIQDKQSENLTGNWKLPQRGPFGETGNSRMAVVVSTKVFKSAVDRNRAKRLVRESIRHLKGRIKPGYDLVFLVQSEIVGKKQPEVEKEVEFLLGKAELLISNP